MANPIPLTTDGSGPAGAIPVSISGPAGDVPTFEDLAGAVVGVTGTDLQAILEDIADQIAAVNPIVAALITAGFGTAGQVLATNATGDGFEWVTP
jgi:hypothetical protein